MTHWSFFLPTMVLNGPVKDLIAKHIPASKTLLVCSKGAVERGSVSFLQDHLGLDNLVLLDNVQSNPTLEYISHTIDLLRGQGISQVVGFGGGSVIDTSKVLSLFLDYSCNVSLSQHLHHGVSISSCSSLPLIVVPTTCGTGSEVTPFATIWDPSSFKKYSVSSCQLYPDRIFLDSSLLLTCSSDQLFISALDTLSHCLESIWNKNMQPLSYIFSVKAFSLLLDFFFSDDHYSPSILNSLQLAGFYAGISIAHTKTAVAHSISYPLTLKFNIPHGLACSFTLPIIFTYMMKKNPTNFVQFFNDLGFNSFQDCADCLSSIMNLPPIKSLHSQYIAPHRSEILALSSHMMHPDRIKNSLFVPTSIEILDILTASIDRLMIND